MNEHILVRDLLRFDPTTGLFTWLVQSRRGHVFPGYQAGAVNSRGYVVIRISGRAYQAHRLAFLWAKSAFGLDFVRF